jgi:uncharacterized protein
MLNVTRRALQQLSAALTLTVLFALVPVHAQKKPADPATVTAAKDLLIALGSDKQVETMIPLMLQSMRGVIVKQSPGATQAIDEALDAVAKKMNSRRTELLDLMAIIYAERVTADDLKAMTAFFVSPAGKRFVAMQPEMMQEGARVGQVWGQKLGQEVDAELREELKRRGVKL